MQKWKYIFIEKTKTPSTIREIAMLTIQKRIGGNSIVCSVYTMNALEVQACWQRKNFIWSKAHGTKSSIYFKDSIEVIYGFYYQGDQMSNGESIIARVKTK